MTEGEPESLFFAMRLLLPLLLAATTPSPTPTPNDIVVTARERDAQAARREARAFVREVSSTPVDGQFARWHQPLCPAVSGLSADLEAYVLTRVRRVAEAAGAPSARAGCRVNALIHFTADAPAFVANLERRDPKLLVQVPPAERPALRAGPAPVRWWYTTQSEGADGNQLMDAPSVALGPNGTGDPLVPTNDRTRFNDSYRSSIVSTGLRGAIALVDTSRTAGRLDDVADYAAFVLLARVRPDPPQGAARSILTLFAAEEDGRQRGLTSTDRAYLAALYATPADRPARAQGRVIAGLVARSEAR